MARKIEKIAYLVSLGSLLSMALGSSPSMAELPPLPPPLPSPTPAATPGTSQPPEETLKIPVADPSRPSVSPESPPQDSDSSFIRPQTTCPQDFDTLSTLLVRDIPSYTNRILQSSVADIATAYRPAYVIVASQPEQVPLAIEDRVYTTLPDSAQQLRQLFFTTLERQYSGLEATSLSHFHWLFLAPDTDGWRMVFMFSTIDAEGAVQLPPRDSSQGSVGQAVKRWLVDCRAEAISIE
ncbi:MAG: hypothetical protein AAGF93_17970 [Cyanobacteria bacterium P01_H01_bin.105]